MDFDPPPCPACGEPGPEVLRDTGAHVTFQCQECDEVFRTSPRRLRTRTVSLIIAQGAESRRTTMEVVTEDDIEPGAEFELDGARLMVTAVEGPGGLPMPRVRGQDVTTIHAKHFDTVDLRFSVNEGPVTKSYSMPVDPDTAVHIGQLWTVEGRDLIVKTLKSDENRTVRKGGLAARHVRRAFCDEKGRFKPSSPSGPRKTTKRGPAGPRASGSRAYSRKPATGPGKGPGGPRRPGPSKRVPGRKPQGQGTTKRP